MTLSRGLIPPGGVAAQTGISTTLRNALDLPPKTLTPPDGAPGPTDISKTLFLPRDLTRRDGVVAQMDISTTLLRSRCGFDTNASFHRVGAQKLLSFML